jgi:hypothetical protein
MKHFPIYLRAACIFLAAPFIGLAAGLAITYLVWKGDLSCLRGLNK